MKKIILLGAMVVMVLSVLQGAASGTTAEAKSKTASHRCSIVKGCRVRGKHHSKKHPLKRCYSKKHHVKVCRVKKHHVKPKRVKKTYSTGHHTVSHHSGHHGSHHR